MALDFQKLMKTANANNRVNSEKIGQISSSKPAARQLDIQPKKPSVPKCSVPPNVPPALTRSQSTDKKKNPSANNEQLPRKSKTSPPTSTDQSQIKQHSSLGKAPVSSSKDKHLNDQVKRFLEQKKKEQQQNVVAKREATHSLLEKSLEASGGRITKKIAERFQLTYHPPSKKGDPPVPKGGSDAQKQGIKPADKSPTPKAAPMKSPVKKVPMARDSKVDFANLLKIAEQAQKKAKPVSESFEVLSTNPKFREKIPEPSTKQLYMEMEAKKAAKRIQQPKQKTIVQKPQPQQQRQPQIKPSPVAPQKMTSCKRPGTPPSALPTADRRQEKLLPPAKRKASAGEKTHISKAVNGTNSQLIPSRKDTLATVAKKPLIDNDRAVFKKPNRPMGNGLPPPPPPITKKQPIHARIPQGNPSEIYARQQQYRKEYNDYRNELEDYDLEAFDDEEVDSEMGSFIDDEEYPEEGGSPEELSKTLKSVFGYDKRKYANEPAFDDRRMESNYKQIQSEEAFSTRRGLMEDLEEYKRELGLPLAKKPRKK